MARRRVILCENVENPSFRVVVSCYQKLCLIKAVFGRGAPISGHRLKLGRGSMPEGDIIITSLIPGTKAGVEWRWFEGGTIG